MATTDRAPLQTARFQEKREAVLGAAAALFNEQGVRGATLAGIAAQVGLVTNSVTYYYRKKEDLATACFQRSIEALNKLSALAAREATPEQRVATFFAAQAELLCDMAEGRHPALVFFNDLRALPHPQVDEVFAAYTDMFRRVRALLVGEPLQGLARDALNARTHLLLSVTHWVRSWIDRYETDEYPRVARRVVDMLLHGLAGGGASWLATGGEPGWTLIDPAGAEGEVTRDAFLRAATFLVNEQGYRGASVDKISARLNVTKGSFYHHHDTKEDLITACFERSFTALRRALLLAEDSPGRGFDRACAAARALVRFQCGEQGPLLRSTAMSALPDEQHRRHVRLTLQRLTERMASVLVDGMMDGSVRAQDPQVAAQSLLAMINASAELHRWVQGVDGERAVALYVRPAFEGLLCSP